MHVIVINAQVLDVDTDGVPGLTGTRESAVI
jgi:hypothetical protein